MNALISEARRMAPGLSQGTPVVYFLRLRSGSIYIGTSLELEQRLEDHVSGRACRTTALDAPRAILRIEILTSFPEARAREAQLKGWSRAKKEALIQNDLDQLRMLSQSRDQPPFFSQKTSGHAD
jgi:putative endonuclease